ncbi:MAG TPA: class A beta-lactamase [Brevundimonas sp.]|jgi:beta-lactamase class A|uniref:class A beta-lactamase n=1 Tax=Brevundimonas sp. TaxID=1871086 RepID=UPI002EDB3D02
MTVRTDRRSVLTGFGALGLIGCSPRADAVAADVVRPTSLALDFGPLERRHGGRLGFTAVVPGGDRIDWRASERFVYCSTFKMYLAAAVLERVQRGEERLDRAVPVTRADMVNHAPVTEPAIGSTLTIETLCKAVVEVSDNPAANILIREMGGLDVLRAWYRLIGDDSTTVDRLEPMMNRLDGDKDTITPAQSAENLQRLFLSEETPLTPESKTRLLRWMFDSPTGMARIKAGVPAGWRVAHKTGTGGYGPTNDIGLAYAPSGQTVIIAAYYHGAASSSDADNEAVIAEATRMAVAALGLATA